MEMPRLGTRRRSRNETLSVTGSRPEEEKVSTHGHGISRGDVSAMCQCRQGCAVCRHLPACLVVRVLFQPWCGKGSFACLYRICSKPCEAIAVPSSGAVAASALQAAEEKRSGSSWGRTLIDLTTVALKLRRTYGQTVDAESFRLPEAGSCHRISLAPGFGGVESVSKIDERRAYSHRNESGHGVPSLFLEMYNVLRLDCNGFISRPRGVGATHFVDL